jgi:(p)ppGpp synthase/HD superfamily hydrolase
MSGIEFLSRENLSKFIEESKLRIDDFVIAAMDVAEEVHGSVNREDKSSSFLESHTWPVTKDVINHLLAEDRNITSVEIASAILHDILEDNDKILDWYRTKDYGFDAYLRFRFGNRIYKMCNDLKIKPIFNFPGKNDEERQLARFHDYCSILSTADYDVKAIKLADRINNMNFIYSLSELKDQPIQFKIRRYLREAEDFYLAYALLPPSMEDFYQRLRASYDNIKMV